MVKVGTYFAMTLGAFVFWQSMDKVHVWIALPPGRKARKNGEGSGGKEGERRTVAGTSKAKGFSGITALSRCGWPFSVNLSLLLFFFQLLSSELTGFS
ncbi:hypothetical protein Acr_29g0003600 [Actinidia rufa]|uniref:Uncharacterized protein n=1 Tax=Actinidia rufa TaxID=165716 RepID=A0A7J0HDR2_9ERIC|nr:hypothetical protein Acr_29g0003600 [Actinidia rufa]